MDPDKKGALVASTAVADIDIGQVEHQRPTFWAKFASYVWDSDMHLKSPQVIQILRS